MSRRSRRAAEAMLDRVLGLDGSAAAVACSGAKMSRAFKGVRGGTASGPALCRTCRYASYRQGRAISQSLLDCTVTGERERMRWEAVECSDYDDKSSTELYEMKKIAWQLRTDAVTKAIVGFVAPRAKKEDDE